LQRDVEHFPGVGSVDNADNFIRAVVPDQRTDTIERESIEGQ